METRKEKKDGEDQEMGRGGHNQSSVPYAVEPCGGGSALLCSLHSSMWKVATRL